MNMKHRLTMMAFAFLALCAQAQKTEFERPNSYNVNRAIELYKSEQYSDALEYLQREVQNNDKNGYAFILIADIYIKYEEYGKALTSVNKAIKLMPKKDEDYMVFAYRRRADIYLELADTVKAYNDYAAAIKAYPNNINLYYSRAQLFFEQKRWSESNADYRKMIDIDPGDVAGYIGLGRNANGQEQFEEAIRYFSHVIKVAPTYSSGFSFRSDSYIGLKQYDKAADDIVSALGIDGDDKAFFNLATMADSAITAIISKLQIKAMMEPKLAYWPYCTGIVYEHAKNYHKAIEYYLKAMDIEPDDITANRISNCYDELGNYEMALQYIDKAISMNPEKSRYLQYKANILDNAGRRQEAIEEISKYIEQNPDNAIGYYCRGRFKDHSSNIDGAIDDYNLSIALDDEYTYTHLNRGVLLRLQGREDEARVDFKKVIKLDTVPNRYSKAMFAFYYLGQKDKALDFMDKVLKENKDKYYDAACLYSIMGDTVTSISHLQLALEHGYRCFAHIENDRDLNNIRKTQEFIELIDEFKRKHETEIETKDNSNQISVEDSVAEVPFTKENGICKVICTINDLPLHFIFDTGASTVSISNVEATFMYKNGYIKREDIIGKQNFVDANGDVNEGTIINLRRINFGGFVLDNVRASVVRNQKAPMLLGQSVLGRLGKIEIDNSKQIIRISIGK